MYPAYKADEALSMFARTFFTLLNEGYRLRYSAASLAAQIADLPYMSKEDRNKFYRQLEYAATHPSDILDNESESSDPAEIKKLLGGK